MPEKRVKSRSLIGKNNNALVLVWQKNIIEGSYLILKNELKGLNWQKSNNLTGLVWPRGTIESRNLTEKTVESRFLTEKITMEVLVRKKRTIASRKFTEKSNSIRIK